MEASRNLETPLDNPLHYREWMQETGFVNVEEIFRVIPLNYWPKDKKLKEIGRYQCVRLSGRAQRLQSGLVQRNSQKVCSGTRDSLSKDSKRYMQPPDSCLLEVFRCIRSEATSAYHRRLWVRWPVLKALYGLQPDLVCSNLSYMPTNVAEGSRRNQLACWEDPQQSIALVAERRIKVMNIEIPMVTIKA